MGAVMSLLVIVLGSMIVVKVATVALTMTGLDPEIAHLQALSAFSGTGFTTHESESVIHHPLRRRIIKLLIMAGNAGLTSAMAALVVTVIGVRADPDAWLKLLLVAGGLTGLFLVSRSRWLGRILSRVIERLLDRLTPLELKDYATLLEIGAGYSVSEIVIRQDSPIVGKALRELNLTARGIVVIGVRRADGKYEGVPSGATTLFAGDVALCYGVGQRIREFWERSVAPS
jgi:hypothetical protein